MHWSAANSTVPHEDKLECALCESVEMQIHTDLKGKIAVDNITLCHGPTVV